jgi:hypothetical protein
LPQGSVGEQRNLDGLIHGLSGSNRTQWRGAAGLASTVTALTTLNRANNQRAETFRIYKNPETN